MSISLKLVWTARIIRQLDDQPWVRHDLAKSNGDTPAEALSSLREIVRAKHDDSREQLDLIGGVLP